MENKRAVIYARYSSDRQREESIEGQIRECTAFAKRSNLDVINTYTDRALSARTDNRPSFQKLIRDSNKRIFDYVIVYTLDRFSRSRYDSAVYKNKLKKNGVKVLSAKEHIEDTPSGIILESVLEGYAEYYSAELAQKVKRGLTDNVLEHKWTGTCIPFGYKKDDANHLVPDAVTSPLIPRIYEAALGGKSRVEIARWLNEKGYITTYGRRFRPEQVTKILKNRIYTGTFTWDGKQYPAFTTPLITEELFDKVQKTFRKNTRKNPEDYVLTGKIYCGRCGSTMTGMSGTSKSRKTYYYYRCSSMNHSARQAKEPCGAKNVSRDMIEKLIYDKTLQILNTPEWRKEIAHQAMLAQSDDSEELKIKAMEQELSDAKRKITNIITAISNGISSEELAKTLHDLEARKKELESQISHEQLVKKDLTLTEDAIEFYFVQLARKSAGGSDLNVFWDFINHIVVYDDYIEVFYNYVANKKIANPVIIQCSPRNVLVDHQGFEPRTP